VHRTLANCRAKPGIFASYILRNTQMCDLDWRKWKIGNI